MGTICGQWQPLGDCRESRLRLSHTPWASGSTVQTLSFLLLEATQIGPTLKEEEAGSPQTPGMVCLLSPPSPGLPRLLGLHWGKSQLH